ncbi:MAG TPA: amino acid ABC transporter permease [Actinomycetota bacterium]|nr:amino acid ABC transporter permease [Actinomycetota bacterium]
MSALEIEAEAGIHREAPPDTRGPSSPISATALWLGIGAIAMVLGGVLAVQLNYALSDRVLTEHCIEVGLTRDITGALGVCNIIEALRAQETTALLYVGAALGIAGIAVGFGIYRKMDTVRRREQAITGALLGILAVQIAVVLLVFRSGRPDLFAKHFLNFTVLSPYFITPFLNAMKNTIVLAFAGELGGIIIGLILAMLVLSKRRAARAPARVYINFFRGTPLIWQLATFYFLLLFGFEVRMSAFNVAMIVFALNTGAYAAEVFRAGIQSIERGQMEAARSLGMTYYQAMRFAIVPQAVRRVIPPLMNEFVILVKDTALVIVLGLLISEQELFQWARSGVSDTFNATFYTATALGYLTVTLPLIYLVNQVERRLRSGLVGITGAGH